MFNFVYFYLYKFLLYSTSFNILFLLNNFFNLYSISKIYCFQFLFVKKLLIFSHYSKHKRKCKCLDGLKPTQIHSEKHRIA